MIIGELCTPQHMCEDQRTALWNLLSPIFTWLPEIQLGTAHTP